MNCQDVIDLLDSRPGTSLSRTQEERLTEHALVCESCENALRASRLLRLLSAAPVPSPKPDLLKKSLAEARLRQSLGRPRFFGVGRMLGVAVAASLAVFSVTTLLPPSSSEQADLSSGFTIALYEARDITVAIDSAEALRGAQIHVALTGGIELEGKPGRRDIRWTADINAGVNRLTLPVVASGEEDAQILVEVEHDMKRRRFVLPIDVVRDAAIEGPTVG